MLDEIEGVKLPFGERFFQEFVVDVGSNTDKVLGKMKGDGILAGIPLAGHFPELGEGAFLVAVSEKRSRNDLELYCESLKRALQ